MGVPYTVPVGGILEASIRGTLFGQKTISLFHYRLNDTTIPDGAAFLATFNTSFNAATGVVDAYRQACTSDLTLDEVRYQWIYPNRFRAISFTPFAAAGSVGPPTLPPNVSGAITKEADVATRHGVGTLHMPALSTNEVTGGTVSVAQVARYNAVAAALKLALVTARMDPVIFNRSAGNLSPVITQAFAQTTSRVMRRRTVGLGI